MSEGEMEQHTHRWSPGVNVHGPYWRRICEVCGAEILTSEAPPEDERFTAVDELFRWWDERFGQTQVV